MWAVTTNCKSICLHGLSHIIATSVQEASVYTYLRRLSRWPWLRLYKTFNFDIDFTAVNALSIVLLPYTLASYTYFRFPSLAKCS